MKCQGLLETAKAVATNEMNEDTVCSGDDEDEPIDSVDMDTDTDDHSCYTSSPPSAKVTSLPPARAPSRRKK